MLMCLCEPGEAKKAGSPNLHLMKTRFSKRERTLPIERASKKV